ncbi:Decaprenyl-diphosphate synthase subunit 2 [Orchesella cincta]|uniref:Decaprenyl-diphosphate synthase subunit 2 n=1 Tax=Orchesella cincta TaxID=48709 RepID=A0A1D2NEM7_ORCCI|nr:Decaprenyl-diphosphate synthase subunit 2 [Orchesella cincta]
MLRRLLLSVQKKLSQQFQPVTYYYTTPSVETVSTAPTSSSSKSIIYESNPIMRNLPKPSQGQSYSTLMSNAERCVDPGSVNYEESRSQVVDLISLKKLLSSNPEMKKLVVKLAESLQQIGEVRHPFVSTAGDLFFGDSPPILTPGVLVLLISKLAGHAISASSSYAPRGDIYYSGAASDRQILLARGIVLNAAAYELHRTVIETVESFADRTLDLSRVPALHQGNKMAILTGDMLVVNTVRSISAIENNRVFGLIMNTVADFSISEIQSTRPFKKLPNGKLRFTPPISTDLAESFLLAAGFRSAMLLAGHSQSVQDQASKLGRVVGALWKVKDPFTRVCLPRLSGLFSTLAIRMILRVITALQILVFVVILIMGQIPSSECDANAMIETVLKTEPIRSISNTAQQSVNEAKHRLSPRKRRQPGRKRHKYRSTMKVLPADESLLHDFSSADVEIKLGKAHIERFRRHDAKVKDQDQDDPKVIDARVHDLEEVFGILTRRDGYVLEQLLSLKDAVNKIIEFLDKQGISKLPPDQRDAYIKNIVKETIKMYSMKKYK